MNGRNSDNTLIKKYLGWEPITPLRVGMEKTYRWIRDQYQARERRDAGVVRESRVLHYERGLSQDDPAIYFTKLSAS